MQLSHELGIDEDEILEWPKDKFDRWVAYFNVAEEVKKKNRPKG